jgi:TonB family protein
VKAAPQEAADPRLHLPNIRTETRLVVTEAKVSFPNGRAVEGLTVSDFEITEDGVPQTIQFCEFKAAEGVYVLGYYPRSANADGQFRKIYVAVKTATSARVESREGYRIVKPLVGVAAIRGTPDPPASLAMPYDKPPALVFKKEPDYSDEARKAKYQGVVLLDVQIDAAGNVRTPKVVRSLGLGLDEKAMEAVKQWRFRPAMKGDHPVAAEIVVEVSFRLL